MDFVPDHEHWIVINTTVHSPTTVVAATWLVASLVTESEKSVVLVGGQLEADVPIFK